MDHKVVGFCSILYHNLNLAKIPLEELEAPSVPCAIRLVVLKVVNFFNEVVDGEQLVDLLGEVAILLN